ncbi:uncharacterized protein LOC141629088 [Silene latifolia]|uniref:uncharacterized protein LOC141629088 n=1 Tax=Silene latifolia TaxID=37657 RepID=UPI003D7765FE
MNKLGLFGLLETKVKALSLKSLVGILMDDWSISTNNRWHKGGGIWILWNPSIYQVEFCDYSAQCINMRVSEIASNKIFCLSMVYAFNNLTERKPLWDQLEMFAITITYPWVVCGDFNCVLSHSERLGGTSSDVVIDDLQACLTRCGLVDCPAVGSLFTWNNMQEPATRVYSRLDRVLINAVWRDRLLLIKSLSSTLICEGKLLSFFHLSVSGGIRSIMNLEYIQGQIAHNPGDVDWIAKEVAAAQEYKDMQSACQQFLSQKTKAAWIKDGACNTKIFHGVIKSKFIRNQVLSIKNINGIEHDDPHGIQEAFLAYYNKLLGTENAITPVNKLIVRKGNICNATHWDILLKPVTKNEIKEAIFSLPDNQAPGPDGFSSAFLRTLGVSQERKYVLQFWMCLNLYVSKLLYNRFAGVLPDLISLNQDAFSAASGLQMNAQKSCAYFNGVKNNLKKDILAILGFSEGNLPFKYHGVPITAGRLKKQDCAMLIDKIVERIRSVGAKKLSYAGRLILVNSVLSSMYNYWAVMFVLPKGVMTRVDAICRKLVWWLAAKTDKLWVQWVHHVYMKNYVWFDYQPSAESSWHWRKICNVRDLIMEGFIDGQWSIGSGDYTVKSCYEWIRDKKSQVAADDLCCISQLSPETHIHLMDTCHFSQSVLQLIGDWLGTYLLHTNILNVIACRRWSRLRKQICTAAILACWYMIWMQMNEARIYGRVIRPVRVALTIQWMLKNRFIEYKPRVISTKDSLWLCRMQFI